MIRTDPQLAVELKAKPLRKLVQFSQARFSPAGLPVCSDSALSYNGSQFQSRKLRVSFSVIPWIPRTAPSMIFSRGEAGSKIRNACDEATHSEDRLPAGPQDKSSAAAVQAARLRAACGFVFSSCAGFVPRASPCFDRHKRCADWEVRATAAYHPNEQRSLVGDPG